MAKRMLIDALHTEETRVVIADDNQVYDFDFVTTAKKQLKGNIYLAKITRVEPSLQAAFVEYGGGKQGFLPFSEIHTDYYQIPMSDRKRLMEEAERDVSDDSEQDHISSTGNEGEVGDAMHATQESGLESDSDQHESAAADEPSPPLPLPDEITHVEHSEHDELHDATERPAYLTEGAIDISLSEAVEPSEGQEHPSEEGAVHTQETSEGEQQEAKSGETRSEDVETLASEEDEFQARPKKNLFLKRYKIQEVIRRGQIVLVQVIKEERGNKGVSLTTYLSLAGRYCVLMPNSPKDGGISRKIASAEDRKRLKAISTELRLAKGMSVIIRTAGLDRTRAEIKRDFDYLVKLWNRIREDTLTSTAPALIYEESDIIKRAIRDQYANDIDEVIVEGDTGYKTAKDFMKLLLPSHTPKIKHYKEPTPLFYAYNIEDQLLSMHDPVVKLRSGGYIVINPTEALISIDVNSGRATGERNIEETAAKTNLEAAVEVARQLRLRDLAGLIVIDFIDMMESRNRRAVEKILKDSLKMDRAKIQLGRISPFGLLEMSRQRLRPSISETNMVQCAHCVGRGYVRSNESMCIQIIRAIEKEASAGNWMGLRLLAPQATALHMLNFKRDALREIEQRYGLMITVAIGADLTSSDFNVEKIRKQGGERNAERSSERSEGSERRNNNRRPERTRPTPAPIAAAEESGESNVQEIEGEDGPREEGTGGERKSRARRGRRGRNRRGPNDRVAAAEGANAPAEEYSAEIIPMQQSGEEAASSEGNEGGEDAQGQPRQRTDRGRRRWRNNRNRDERPRREDGEAGNEQAAVSETTSWPQDNSNQWNDGAAAPAFATREPVLPPPAPKREAVAVESTPRDPNAPSKKGWWQKIIELDD